MDRAEKLHRLEELRAEAQRLESELTAESSAANWPPRSYYTVYHVLAGFVLGIFGACTSLLFNVIGSVLTHQDHPLRLIQVYLTFPLGAEALQITDGITLTIGCCLYLGTGMLLGIPFQLLLSRYLPRANFVTRLAATSVLALAIWVINFYGILAWLQPLLFGGNWIVSQVPWWVGAMTHLVFGWTMLLVQPLGVYVPFQERGEAA